jgi:hypothetical protein
MAALVEFDHVWVVPLLFLAWFVCKATGRVFDKVADHWQPTGTLCQGLSAPCLQVGWAGELFLLTLNVKAYADSFDPRASLSIITKMNTSYTILPNEKIDLGVNSTWWMTLLVLFCLWACVFTHAYYFSPVGVTMAQHGHYTLVLILNTLTRSQEQGQSLTYACYSAPVAAAAPAAAPGSVVNHQHYYGVGPANNASPPPPPPANPRPPAANPPPPGTPDTTATGATAAPTTPLPASKAPAKPKLERARPPRRPAAVLTGSIASAWPREACGAARGHGTEQGKAVPMITSPPMGGIGKARARGPFCPSSLFFSFFPFFFFASARHIGRMAGRVR